MSDTLEVTPPKSGRPTQEEAQRRVENLLRVALELFVQRGYEATTLVEIASAARVATRTIYARFSDKQALFEAVVRRILEGDGRETSKIDNELPVGDALRAHAVAMLRAAQRPNALALHQLIIQEGRQFPEIKRINARQVEKLYLEPLKKYLKRKVKEGVITVPNVNLSTEIFAHIVFMDVTYFALLGDSQPKYARLNQHLECGLTIFIKGILNS